MTQQYYMVKDNRRIGPAAIESLLAQGLGADTLVWRVGLAQWVSAAQLPEVASLLPALPTPPPIPQTPPDIPLSAPAPTSAPAIDSASKIKSSKLSYVCLYTSILIFIVSLADLLSLNFGGGWSSYLNPLRYLLGLKLLSATYFTLSLTILITALSHASVRNTKSFKLILILSIITQPISIVLLFNAFI